MPTNEKIPTFAPLDIAEIQSPTGTKRRNITRNTRIATAIAITDPPILGKSIGFAVPKNNINYLLIN